MDRENFVRFPYQNSDFQRFQGAAGVGPYMSHYRQMNRSSEGVHLTITAPKFFQARSLIERASLKWIFEEGKQFR